MRSKNLDELVPDLSLLPPDLQFLVRYARFMDAALRIPLTNVRFCASSKSSIRRAWMSSSAIRSSFRSATRYWPRP